ncbi:UDP-glucoronosyl and UDP-glucosyl transferase domain-containing protein [Sarocladium implicatum]|nr:UDP-glucoronosyl and UDP-glucosyl transferase domain-containing protein [Sarocladium implicatum]
MTTTAHVICVPFPGAGHGINMCNIAMTLASENVRVHSLVLSSAEAEKWLRGTGQPPNTFHDTQVILGGKYENTQFDWPKGLMAMLSSAEFNEGIGEAIRAYNERGDRVVAVIYNAMMLGVGAIAKQLGVKRFLCMPVPYYMLRLGGVYSQGCNISLKEKFKMEGLGGVPGIIEVDLGDVIESTTSMSQILRPEMEAADGIIMCNTNRGIEGDHLHQNETLPPYTLRRTKEYFIGPILPVLYERALEDSSARAEFMAQAGMGNPVLEFMDRQENLSVVYISWGSHVVLQKDQAKLLVETLRKTKTPWVILCRSETDEIREMLGGSDGVVTPWAPQMQVMLHRALKCVISHGGFGTLMEGVYAGVPFMTAPVMSDQFLDSKVLVKLGISQGTIAENPYIPSMERATVSPQWPSNQAKRLETLFGRMFGTEEGEKMLAESRQASVALRQRLINRKRMESVQELEQLKMDMFS